MRLKLIEWYALAIMRAGVFFSKLGEKWCGYGINVNIKYKTETGKTLEIMKEIVKERLLQENRKTTVKSVKARGEAYHVKHTPKKDN